MAIKRGIAAVAVVVQELRNLSKPTQDQREIAQVGTISANNAEEIGLIVSVVRLRRRFESAFQNWICQSDRIETIRQASLESAWSSLNATIGNAAAKFQ